MLANNFFKAGIEQACAVVFMRERERERGTGERERERDKRENALRRSAIKVSKK